MDLASVVAALASVGVRVSGSTPNSSVQVVSSRACPTGLAGPEPSGTINDPGQHFHAYFILIWPMLRMRDTRDRTSDYYSVSYCTPFPSYLLGFTSANG